MKRWVMAAKKADFNEIARKFSISPMLARIIRNRDAVTDDEIDSFLNGTPDTMHDPALLKDIDKAAQRIMKALDAKEKVRVIGDYDIDGVCSSYILKKSFSLMGIDCDVKLPDRILDGYGLNKNLIEKAHDDGVKLIVTCDNGIAACSEIEYALSLGIDVVVTDHHEVPVENDPDTNEKRYIIPPAYAVVDPKQEDDTYPYENICGAMVAYKLIVYIIQNYPKVSGAFSGKIMDELLVFAAFATVGDVMPLLDENRIAVKHGLRLMSECENTGLRALIEVTGLDKNSISAYHIGFVLGPCMNATGRLDSAERALGLLGEQDYEKAVLSAKELKELNESRKNMTDMYAKEAMKMAETDEYRNDRVLVLYIPECHESLAGIVAGRVREKYYKPTIILTKGREGVKGSGRSIDDYNMFEELSKVKHLFTRFGGHKMAAGLSLEEDNIGALRRGLNSGCSLTEEELTEKFVIDIPMPIAYADMKLAVELEKLSPFGVGNPKPLFAQKDVRLDNLRLMGKNQNVLKMNLFGMRENGTEVKLDAVLFDNAAETYEALLNRERISVLYQIDINSYKGRESVQLIIKDWY